VLVGVLVFVGVLVGVSVIVGVGVLVGVSVGVTVFVGVMVGVTVFVGVGVGEGGGPNVIFETDIQPLLSTTLILNEICPSIIEGT
jgi:hypothetical protein